MMIGVITMAVFIGMLNSEHVSYGYTMKRCILWELSVLPVDANKGVLFTQIQDMAYDEGVAVVISTSLQTWLMIKR